ncbi:MAG TPA: response regulator [Pyrinomonadaceae bacterium]|jgi:CheY-like chemotaxis protein
MILFIDDEPRLMDSHYRYLKFKLEPEGYEVIFCSTVDEALDYFEKHLGELDLIILDIMMPSDKRFSSKKTNGGLKTGLLFYDKIREGSPDLPVLIFTNFFDEDVEQTLKQDPNCRFLQKANYLMDEFAEEVKRTLSKRAR